MCGVFQRPGGGGRAHQPGQLQREVVCILPVVGDKVRITNHIEHQIGGEEINDIGFFSFFPVLPDAIVVFDDCNGNCRKKQRLLNFLKGLAKNTAKVVN